MEYSCSLFNSYLTANEAILGNWPIPKIQSRNLSFGENKDFFFEKDTFFRKVCVTREFSKILHIISREST